MTICVCASSIQETPVQLLCRQVLLRKMHALGSGVEAFDVPGVVLQKMQIMLYGCTSFAHAFYFLFDFVVVVVLVILRLVS